MYAQYIVCLCVCIHVFYTHTYMYMYNIRKREICFKEMIRMIVDVGKFRVQLAGG